VKQFRETVHRYQQGCESQVMNPRSPPRNATVILSEVDFRRANVNAAEGSHASWYKDDAARRSQDASVQNAFKGSG
jgi:hypothetical protein